MTDGAEAGDGAGVDVEVEAGQGVDAIEAAGESADFEQGHGWEIKGMGVWGKGLVAGCQKHTTTIGN